jgi:hypothetical protein
MSPSATETERADEFPVARIRAGLAAPVITSMRWISLGVVIAVSGVQVCPASRR